MTPIQQPKNDTKLLLTVAGFVVAGAAGIALLAGLGADRESATVAKHTIPAPPQKAVRSVPRPIQVMPASLERTVEPIEPSPMPAVVEAELEFQVEPDADFVARGLETYRGGEFDKAAAYFSAEIDARPERPWTQYMLGLSLWKAERLDEAAAAMEESAKLDPTSIKAWTNLARIQNDRGEFDAALAASDEALTVDADDATARFLQGRSLRNLGRLDEALTALATSSALDPDNGYMMNLLGLAMIDNEDSAGAVEVLVRAVELQPDVAYIHNNLGMALELGGNREEAIAAYRAAVECDASHTRAAANLARMEPATEIADETTVAIAAVDGTDDELQ